MRRPLLVTILLTVFALLWTACDQPTTTQTPAADESPAGQAPGETQPAEEPPAEQPAAEGERLATVQENGQLVCGVNGSLPGFSFLDQTTNEMTGFDADFCRAVAAAVLGDPEAVEFRALTADARGPALQTGEIDVLIRNTTHTVSRDTQWGLFGPTIFYDGQGMMVRAEDDIASLEDLAGATICVQTGTTTELNLADVLEARGIELAEGGGVQAFGEIEQTYSAYDAGDCDAVTSDRSQLVSQRTTLSNPDDHVILDEVMSKEPLAPAVPLGDDQWFNIVKWTVYATIEAEELEITSDNVEEMAGSEDPAVARLLGAEGDLGLGLDPDWVVNVISAVGNYGEIYDRNLGPDTPFALERGPNSLWTEGGLLYAPPYR